MVTVDLGQRRLGAGAPRRRDVGGALRERDDVVVAVVHAQDAPIRMRGALPLSLVRLSIGLEEPDVLIRDLEQALARI